MINIIIANALGNKVFELDSFTKVSGCVTETKKGVKGKFTKTIPTVTRANVDEAVTAHPEDNSTLIEMIPSSRHKGILYFEDLGAKQDVTNNRLKMWEGNLRVVGWLNFEALDEGLKNTLDQDVKNVISAFDLSDIDNVHLGRINYITDEPRTPHPFKKYSYDEKKTQFVTWPFDYFSFRINYTAYTNNNIC